jgi:hypothetical protein
MKNFNNLAIGLGVAVIGFAVYEYMRSKGGSSASGGTSGATPNAGALWQNLTFPLGTATGGTNSVGMSNVYSSTSWNPDAISAAIAQDSQNALQAMGYNAPIQFTMPG